MALTDNLVAYYKLDGNSNDSVGSNNGTDTSITYSTGKIGQCASFNGSSSKISIPTIINSSEVSSSGWIYVSNIYPSNDGKVLDIRNIGLSQQFMSRIYSGQFQYLVGDGVNYISLTYNINANTWYHFVCTLKTGEQKLYINGNLVASDNKNFLGLNIGGNGLGMIGQEYNGAYPRYYTGYIDEVGIWSRALSAEEVSDLWNEGAGFSFPFLSAYISGLVKLNNSLIENAKIYCVDQTSNEVVDVLLSDENGFFKFKALDVDTKYHIAVEYEDNENKLYNAKSLYDIIPIESS